MRDLADLENGKGDEVGVLRFFFLGALQALDGALLGVFGRLYASALFLGVWETGVFS
jgi:hypothetical protein